MTRINTNVSSLVAQNRLQSSNNSLQEALTRLSTGLRINKGADDPAGLIASESLRSDITGLNKAITNTKRASQIISTADSALGQVSSLLNDIRGLVVEASNNGALSDDEIAANQLQIDSSLEAINRIGQTTTFQGRKLLDGSLDFVSTVNSVNTVTDARIDQANLGATGSVDVNVNISSAAEQAAITASSSAFSAATTAETSFEFTNQEATVASDIEVTADSGIAAGTNITFVDSTTDSDGAALAAGAVDAAYDADTNTLTVYGNGDGIAQSVVATAIGGVDGFTATATTPATVVDFTTTLPADVAMTATAPEITIAADTAGSEFSDVNVKFESGSANAANYDADSKTLTVTVDNSAAQTLASLKTVIDATEFNATIGTAGLVNIANTTISDQGTGNSGGENLKDDLVFELTGTDGAETFNFKSGASINHVAAAVNLVSDTTGVTAAKNSGALDLTTSAYGSKATVAVDIISEGISGTFESSLDATRTVGADIVAQVNGTSAKGVGNSFSINTSTLDLSMTVDAGSDSDFSFSITGGGAKFQLGANVVSNQQARLGIGSVGTGKLGGASGRLYELGSGESSALDTDSANAAKIVDEVIDKVTSLRGRLGAFQSTTLESNLISLNETVVNLQEAESSIRDADFAAESANLTRAQILVQSGTNVLSLANQNPQNVLALLR
ncbi:MAG: flagellin [Pirellulaceae bacterium]